MLLADKRIASYPELALRKRLGCTSIHLIGDVAAGEIRHLLGLSLSWQLRVSGVAAACGW